MEKNLNFGIIKKILLCVFVLVYFTLLVLVSVINSEPDIYIGGDNYYIDSCEITAVVGKDSVIHVTAKVKADFYEPDDSITWYVDSKQIQEDGSVVYNRIGNIQVQDKEWNCHGQNGVYEIEIKGEDKSEEMKTYEISYDVLYHAVKDEDYGDDLIDWNILGTNQPYDIGIVRCKVIFENIYDYRHIALGALNTETVISNRETIDEDLHLFVYLRDFTAGNELCVSGGLGSYFDEKAGKVSLKRSVPQYYLLFAVLISVVILLIGLSLREHRRNKRPDNLEIYPPSDLDAVQAGVLIDEKIRPRHIVSALLWFLNNGYMALRTGESPEEIEYVGIREPGRKLPEYMEEIYFTLLGDRGCIKQKELQDAVYGGHFGIFLKIWQFFKGKGRLYFTGPLQAVLLAAAAVCQGCGILALDGGLMFQEVLIALLFAIYMIGWGYFRCQTINSSGYPGSQEDKWNILWIAGYFPLIYMLVKYSTEVDVNTTMLCLIPLIFIFLLPYSCRLNRTNRVTRRQLEGLAKFIINVEQGQMKELFEDNSDYFYQVLPYAYAIGLEDCWTDKCRGLVKQAPPWLMEGCPNFSWQIWIKSFDDIQKQLNETVKPIRRL